MKAPKTNTVRLGDSGSEKHFGEQREKYLFFCEIQDKHQNTPIHWYTKNTIKRSTKEFHDFPKQKEKKINK